MNANFPFRNAETQEDRSCLLWQSYSTKPSWKTSKKKQRAESHCLSSLNWSSHYQIPEAHWRLWLNNKGSTLPEILPSIFHFRLQNWILWNNVWHLPSFPIGKTSKHQHRSISFSQKKTKQTKSRKLINWNIYYSNTTSQGNLYPDLFKSKACTVNYTWSGFRERSKTIKHIPYIYDIKSEIKFTVLRLSPFPSLLKRSNSKFYQIAWKSNTEHWEELILFPLSQWNTCHGL